MLSIAKMFLIDEIAAAGPFVNSLVGVTGSNNAGLTKQGRTTKPVGVEVAKIAAAKENIVKPTPGQQGYKPSGIST